MYSPPSTAQWDVNALMASAVIHWSLSMHWDRNEQRGAHTALEVPDLDQPVAQPGHDERPVPGDGHAVDGAVGRQRVERQPWGRSAGMPNRVYSAAPSLPCH